MTYHIALFVLQETPRPCAFSFVPEFFKLVVIHSCYIVCIVDELLLSLSFIVFSMLVDRIDCAFSVITYVNIARFAVALHCVACGCPRPVQSPGCRSLSLYYHEDICSLRSCVSLN